MLWYLDLTKINEPLIKNSFPGTVTRFCKSNDGQPVWGDVNLSNCRSPAVINLLDKVIVKLVILIHITVPSTELI